MPIYSHSQLSTYEECPLKYKLAYRDKIKRDVEGVEAFLGGSASSEGTKAGGLRKRANVWHRREEICRKRCGTLT